MSLTIHCLAWRVCSTISGMVTFKGTSEGPPGKERWPPHILPAAGHAVRAPALRVGGQSPDLRPPFCLSLRLHTCHTSQNPDEAGRLPPRGRRFPQHTAPLFGRSLLVKNVSNFLHTGLVLCSLCCKLHPRLTAWWQVAS